MSPDLPKKTCLLMFLMLVALAGCGDSSSPMEMGMEDASSMDGMDEDASTGKTVEVDATINTPVVNNVDLPLGCKMLVGAEVLSARDKMACNPFPGGASFHCCKEHDVLEFPYFKGYFDALKVTRVDENCVPSAAAHTACEEQGKGDDPLCLITECDRETLEIMCDLDSMIAHGIKAEMDRMSPETASLNGPICKADGTETTEQCVERYASRAVAYRKCEDEQRRFEKPMSEQDALRIESCSKRAPFLSSFLK